MTSKQKKSKASWSDVKSKLADVDRVGLIGLIQDLYAANKDNQTFLHARFGLGEDILKPYKDTISRWICPDVMRNQPISVAKAKKAITDYKKRSVNLKDWLNCRFIIARRLLFSWTATAWTMKAILMPWCACSNKR